MVNFNMKDRVVFVTGGASGIGLAVATMAAEQSCRVAILDMNAEALQRVGDHFRERKIPSVAICCDVRNQDAVDDAVTRVEDELGPIDGLVTSAGISRPSPAEVMPREKWDAVIEVNLTGTFLVCQAVGKRMVERRVGSIVAITSVDSFGGHAHRANYTASKFGLSGMVKSLAIDWGRYGVRVNAVAPGIVDTPLLRANITAEHIEGVMCDRTPLGRLSASEDQASACMFLLSDAASYITAAVLPVDGGLSAGYFTHHYGADVGATSSVY